MIKLSFRWFLSLLFGFCVFLLPKSSRAQSLDFSNLKNTKFIKVSGGLNVNNLYNSFVPVATQKNSYFVNGTLNFNVLGLVDIPLNLNYSNRKFQYSQPFNFNQISITPRYKWATGYFGTTAMTFSPYTLNGHQFSGGGIELMPNKWQVSAMSGRLIRSNSDSTYNRMGYGAKVIYNPGKYRFGITYFQAADNPNSVPIEALERATTRPQKNVVVGLTGGLNLENIGQLDVEFTQSFVGSQLPLSSTGVGEESSLKQIFFSGNGIITRKNAFKSNFSRGFFKGKTVLGVGYERVDPGYKTFGGYFFTDDFENVTVNASQRLLDNKLTIAGNIGRQKDLLETKANGQNRLVASGNVAYSPNERFNLTASYSNFKGFTFIRDLVREVSRESGLIPIDTLNFTQINRNTSVGLAYTTVQKENHSQNISFNGSVLDAANKQGELIRKGQASQVYNGQASYGFSWVDSKLNMNVGYNVNINTIGNQNVRVVGPSFQVQKGFWDEKLSAGIQSNFLQSRVEMEEMTTNAQILNTSLTGSYKVTTKSNLSLSFILLRNQTQGGTATEGLQEGALPPTIYTINVGYTLTF
ncbi:MAG: hypothetical protein ACK4UP_08915 [Spirosomataceae bacterium]